MLSKDALPGQEGKSLVRNNDPILVGWSGGKDCAMALAVLQSVGENVAGLVAGIDPSSATSAMHGVPLSLIERQARAIGIPLNCVPVPKEATNRVFEAAWSDALRGINRSGGTIVWGGLVSERD